MSGAAATRSEAITECRRNTGRYGGRETSVVIYHNSLIISALYDTVEAAIKHLGGSRRETILPDGRVVIPESVNYPELVIRNIFVPFSAVRAEVWPGEPGWGK